MIFTADLEEIEEVGGRCVDGDEILVGGRNGIWERGDCEVLRALGVV